MRWIFVIFAVAACDKKQEPVPPAVPAAPPKSQFRTDREKACVAFSKRAAPSMRGDQGPMDQRIAAECETTGRVNAANYDCLIATQSADDIAGCFAGGRDAGASERFKTDKPGACLAYAQHVIALMSGDLERTMMEACLSERMKETTWDCVMAAKADADFKLCLGLSP